MMYRHENSRSKKRHPRRRMCRVVGVITLLLTASVALYAYRTNGATGEKGIDTILTGTNGERVCVEGYAKGNGNVVRRRIKREKIPSINWNSTTYKEVFNDSNYVHLSAARAIGIDPQEVGNPSENERLSLITTTTRYRVDSMYHSTPYLMHEAKLLLNYIACRFAELQEEENLCEERYKIIVTSALRTEESERRLRRVNRNATDTSCHMYGTTFDISAQRFEKEDGIDEVNERCRRLLATALYELRYEGLCYVKYERGSCFHITLRTTEYEGEMASEKVAYNSPGSPEEIDYTRPVRPAYRTVDKAEETKKSTRSIPIEKRSKADSKEAKPKTKSPVQKSPKTKKETKEQIQSYPQLTEREKMSLQNYERNY